VWVKEQVYKSYNARCHTHLHFKCHWYRTLRALVFTAMSVKAYAQLWQFNMVTHLENLSRLKVWGVTCHSEKSVTGNYEKQSHSSQQWWFPSMTMPDSTLHSRLRTCCKIRLGNVGPSLIHSGFGSRLNKHLTFFFNLQWRCHTSYHHMADTTGTNTTRVQDGLTNHMLWQVPQPWRRLCRKISTSHTFIA